jgi:hypothetical protein
MVQADYGVVRRGAATGLASCAGRPRGPGNARVRKDSKVDYQQLAGVTMKRIIGVAAAALCAASFASYADSTERAEHKADKAQVEANYKAAKANCKTMAGADKKACMKQAKADYKVAKKDVHATHEVREEARDK